MTKKVGADTGCPWDQSHIDAMEERLQKMELRISAKMEAAINKPTNFWLGTSVGQLMWNMLSGLLLMVLVNAACKLNEFVGFVRALRRIKLYMYWRRMQSSNDTEDSLSARTTASTDSIRQSAIVLARHEPGHCTNIIADNAQRQQETSLRQTVRKMLKGLTAPKRTPEKLPTHCSVPTACAAQQVSSNDHNSINQPDIHNVSVPITVLLPDITLATEKAADFQRQATQILHPLHAHLHPLQGGSTFLYATVPMDAAAPSAFTENLLNSAVSLVKMASDFDPACTVQLGDTSLLYMSPGNNVERKLLKKGIHDVPIITSVQMFEAGTIVIKGSYLKETQIIATMSYEKSVCLSIFYHQELEDGLEMLIAELPQDEVLNDRTLIHANKTIILEGCTHPFVLRSQGKKIYIYQENSSIFGTFCTIRFWTCLLVFYVYQFMILDPPSMLLRARIFQLIISFMMCFIVEYLIGPWTFDITTRWLEKVIHSTNLDRILHLIALTKSSIVFNQISRSSMQNLLPNLNPQLQEIDNDEESDYDPEIDSDKESDYGTCIITKEGLVNDPDWEWPCFDRFIRKGKWVTEPAASKPLQMQDKPELPQPFEVVTTIHDDGSEFVKLIVRSALLIQVLKDCQPKTDIQFRMGSSINPREIFLRRRSLRAYVDAHSGHPIIGDSTTPPRHHIHLNDDDVQLSVWYAKHLLRFVERHFVDTLAEFQRMNVEGCVSYEMLWAFLVPGEDVCRRCPITNQECFGNIERMSPSQERSWLVTLNVMDFNVQSYHKCTMRYSIAHFEGEVPFTSLHVCPLQYFPNRKEMEARFVSMGNIFYEVAMQQPFCFMQFKGSVNFHQYAGGCWRLRKLNSDGRVMIDLLSFARMNPDYPLGNAEPPCEVMTGLSMPQSMKKPDNEKLKMAPAYAYGFSFRLKKWGCFEVCGLRKITFNQEAFQDLRMRNEDQKWLLWNVVQHYRTNLGGFGMRNEQSLDPILNKGAGCIMLCHGPPGTGKTLTAEALAETLQCPLWSISAFELGDEPDKVEATLSQIMEISHTWRAILLLDEADGYLVKREEGMDVKRNLLTGVFLRLLEYYRGIMFLTTNRVTAFDDAILSRTTLAICYPALDKTQRLAIWEKLLTRAGIHYDFGTGSYDDLFDHDLNGRQIRNIVHLSQILAQGNKEQLQMTHVRKAMAAFTAGTEDLLHLPTPSSN